MHSRRITTIVWGLILVWLLGRLFTPGALAGNMRLVVVPPFKGNFPYTPLLPALQQMLIDDLQEGLEQPVMTRTEMHTFLQTVAQKPKVHLYISDIAHVSTALNSQFVLINDITESAGIGTWQVKLVQGDTGALVKAWQFKDKLDRLFSMQQHVVAVVRQALLGASKPVDSRAGTPALRGSLATLMAFGHGLLAYDQKDYSAAAQHWRQALQREAAFHYATTHLAQLRVTVQDAGLSPRQMGLFFQADGQYEAAESLLQKALQHNGRDRDVLLALSDMALAQKNYALARQYATKARDSEPKQAQPWIMLGKVAQAEGNAREAQQMLHKAQELVPERAELQQTLAEMAASLGEQDKAHTAYGRAAELYAADLRIVEAHGAIQQAQQLAPKEATHFLATGDLARRVGRHADALKSYQQARSAAPQNATIVQQMANMYKQMGQTKKAVEHYQQALQMTADHFEANFELGQLYVEAGQGEQALPHLAKAKALRPGQTAVQATLAKAYAIVGKQQDMLKELQSFMREEGQTADLHHTYGDALYEAGQVAEAEQHYHKAVRLNPDLATAYTRLAEVAQKLGKTQEALTATAQAKLLHSEIAQINPGSATEAHDITEFIESFPQIRGDSILNQVAMIDMATFVDTPGLFRQLWNQVAEFVQIKKPRLEPIQHNLEGALQQKYHTIPAASVQQKLRAIPYQSMRTDDLNSKQYLADLCSHLGVEALIFYKVINNGITDDKDYTIVIRQVLYEKLRNSLWSNELSLEYPLASLEELNTPYLITLGVLTALALGWISLYLIRGFGRLEVVIRQDEHREKTFFSVVVSKNSNKNLAKTKETLLKKSKRAASTKKYERYMQFYQRRKRYLVLAETTFKRVHVGKYHVYIVGIMTDVIGDEIGNYQMTQDVVIQKRQPHKLIFDLRKQRSRVTIHVRHGEKLAQGADVSVKGQSESRYVKDESGAVFHLPAGYHTLLIHYNSQLVTKEIHVPNLQKSHTFTFNLLEHMQDRAA